MTTHIEGFPWTGDPEVEHLHAPIIPVLPPPDCLICGLPVGKCHCELWEGLCGEAAEPSNP